MALDAEKKSEMTKLVYEGRYSDAMKALSIKERAHAIQLSTQTKIGNVLNDKPLDADAIRLHIILNLENGGKNEEDTALKSIATMAEQEQGATPKSAPKKVPSRPPYQNAFLIDSEKKSHSSFPAHCEKIAQEVFAGTNPHLVAWLDDFQKKYQIPSTTQMHVFAQKSVTGYMKSAQKKLAAKRTDLTPEESDAYYYFNESIADTLERFKTRNETKGFSHLIEYVFIELLDAFKQDIKINHIFKSSPGEYAFRGSDLVVQTTD